MPGQEHKMNLSGRAKKMSKRCFHQAGHGLRSWGTCLCLAIVLLLLGPAPGVAVPENKLPAALDSTILPFFTTQFKVGTMRGAGGVAIHYAKREIAGEQAALVIVDGRTEYTVKYAELFYDLKDMPWSFYIYDHRGQGLSGRMLQDPQKGYVDNFANYVADLKKFIRTVVKRKRHKRLFILAHSMGGTIAVLYSIENPGVLNGIILCSPMLQINTAPYPLEIARLLTEGITALGGGDLYIFGGRPYNPARKFAGNDLTHSLARFDLNKRILRQFPGDELGSPTFQWLDESFKGMKEARAGAGSLKTPVLILEGDDDTVVGRKAEDNFCNQAPACTLVHFPGGRHELLMEKDSIRNAVLKRIKKFIAARCNHRGSKSGVGGKNHRNT
ncbi:MAG TPA: alpha/beta fold hydrolase [Desulfobacteraceae bacterium]|nr:alpha/beta fold hydrolase [Desulfobacteraceae bacterium]